MNECADSAEPAKCGLDEAAKPADKRQPLGPSVPANAVAVSATSATLVATSSPAVDSLPPAEALWNQFLKNISQQSHASRCKYPNPEVPEFYPRSVARGAAPASSGGGAPKLDCAAAKSVRFFNESELLKRVTSDMSDLGGLRGADKAEELTRYYWSFHDVGSELIPRCLNFNADADGARLKHASPAVEPGDGGRADHSTSGGAPATKPPAEASAELATKSQQLAHLNNVVKALLEEIWKTNELSARRKNREQWKNDVSFAIDEFLKPSTELGFHCDDCCDRLREFVTRASKQLEHKIAKQHLQYRNAFVDSVLSVVEGSLRALARDERLEGRPLKRDVCTQTQPECGEAAAGGRASRTEAARRSKLQITKVYRNRNFYKCYDGHEAAKEQWYAAPAARGEQAGGARAARYPAPAKSYAFQSAQHGDAAHNPVNPIQLIHQKYKNLNCRLEGIPDKNMVKFSYIVNGREYSAVASTKKEAQYHCAWHVLGATSQQ